MQKLFCEEKRKLWFLAVVSLLIAVIAYPFLPEQIPFHFDSTGRVDRYGGAWTIFLMPAVIVFLILSAEIARNLDPKKQAYQKFSKQYYGIHFIVSLLFIVLEIYIIAVSVGIEVLNINHLMPFVMGILFMALGNSMPKFKHNYFCGIRTCYTIANEEVWFRTHRFAGKLWFVGGIAMMLTVFLPTNVIMIAFLVIVGVIAIIPVIYSYFVYQRIERNKKER